MDECENLVIDLEDYEAEINDEIAEAMGQSESKKKSKNGVAETKGTAMSFGFRKKLHTTPKKKNLFKDKSNKQYQQNLITNNTSGNCVELIIDDDLNEQIKQEQFNEKYNSATVISNPVLIKCNDFEISDNNGNEGTIDFKSTATTDKTEKTWATMNRAISPSLQNTNNQQQQIGVGGGDGIVGQQTGGPGYKNRFGFRSSNVVRPASTGITPKITDYQENIENNNNTAKRRSKSASGANSTRSVTSNRTNNDQSHPHTANQVRFDDVPKINHIPSINNSEYYQWKQPERKPYGGSGNINHNLTQQHHTQYYGGYSSSGTYNNRYQPPQHTIINTGMHTNVIVKPTAKPIESTTSMGKFTLHTASLPKPQYPVPISLTTANLMDTKNAKQMANNNRKGFFGPRDISTDSGISSLDTTFDTQQQQTKLNCNNNGSPKKFNKTRPRNLEMVINGRHKFEVRDLDTISCESIEPLSLPKLPSVFSLNNQPVPLSGLVRTNTTLSRESQQAAANEERNEEKRKTVQVIADTESVEEEKLYLDRSTVEKDTNKNRINNGNNSSKNSSPGSSRASWCNAGESLAFKDCSSISSSDDNSKDHQNEKTFTDADISSINLDEKPSFLSSFTESVPMVPKPITNIFDNKNNNNIRPISERPQTLSNINDTKFAEMAAAVTDILLDDETSPTDSLVSSTESEEAMLKKCKKKTKYEDIDEKDIDEISPELEVCSPLSPGTPTHASNSLSLSDIGKDFLIDDEIADQPALLFNDKTNDNLDTTQLGNSLTDTPTLMEIGGGGGSASRRSPKSLSKSRNLMQAAIELSLRTPISLRRATLLSKAESLDTLSPCESIASDDLMMDFETSSMDSIDRISQSLRSGNGSAMQTFEDAEIFAELENKGSDMIREWNNILRVHRTGRDSIISHLPARATRLLNRSRLQQAQLNNSNAGSDSPKSGDSFNRKLPSSRASSLHFSNRDTNSSSDDLLLHDKSFRNSMIQDVLYFKKQLMRLRRILQEEEECLLRTDTLNPFEVSNGQFFGTSCAYDKNNIIEQHKEQQQHQQLDNEKNLGSLQSLTDDPLQELADLRRQVVYLQGQVDDRDRTIRFQKNLIDKLESENEKSQTISASTSISEKEVVNSATQTERVRPLSIGQEGLARSKPEYTSYTINHFPVTSTTEITEISPINQQQQQSSRRHTVISTTFTNLNQIQSPRRASIGWDKLQYKPVKTTLIGEPITNSSPINNKSINCNGNINGSSDINKILLNNNDKKLKSTINNNCSTIEKLQQLSPTYLNGCHKQQQQNDDSIIVVENVKLKNGNLLINGIIKNGSDNKVGNINNNNGNSRNFNILTNESSVKCNLKINNNINNKNGFDKTQTNTEICNKINSVTIV